MQFDVALNLIWLALSVFALYVTLRARRAACSARGPAWLHICGVALIIAALFPYVSATDDMLRIRHLDLQSEKVQQASHAPHDSRNQRPADGLIRLYEIMDSPVIGTVQSVALAFSFVSVVVAPAPRLASYDLALQSGRSPPLLLA